MKFVMIAAIVALAKAEVGADCSVDASVCEADVECCGTATPADGSDATESVTVCQTSSEAKFESAEDDALTYDFACNTTEEEAAAKNVAIASVAAILAATAYLA